MDKDKKLLRKLNKGEIKHTDYDAWGAAAGDIDKDWTIEKSLTFWQNILTIINKHERISDKKTHKGLIYFKIAGRKVQLGELFDKGTAYYFKKAVESDKKKYQDWHNQTAFRVLSILEAYRYFYLSNKVQSKEILLLSLKGKEVDLGNAIARYYDETIGEHALLRQLNNHFFKDKLKVRPTERLLFAIECYDGASHLVANKEKLDKTNMAKYGLARAVLALCGSVLEAVLLSKQSVRNSITKGISAPMKKKKALENANLWNALEHYIPKIKGNAGHVLGLILIWQSRNMIHSERHMHYKTKEERHIDMNYASFIWQVTNRVLLEI